MIRNNFDFIGKKKLWLTISLLIIIPGIISLMVQGLNFGIDFAGGTKMTVQFNQGIYTEDIRDVLSEYNIAASSTIQTVQAGDNNQFIIRIPELSEQDTTQIINSLRYNLGGMELLTRETVGSVVSAELQRSAVIALSIAMLLITIYLAVRFDLSFGLATLVGIIHNVLITLSIFSITQIEINIAFAAAILTVVGYTINDTIVIFDRIRENLGFKEKITLEELANKSVHQTLLRTIYTSGTSVVVLLVLLIFGGEATRYFALAMIIGFISGAYSSTCLVSPVWLELKKRWFTEDKRSKKKANPEPSV